MIRSLQDQSTLIECVCRRFRIRNEEIGLGKRDGEGGTGIHILLKAANQPVINVFKD